MKVTKNIRDALGDLLPFVQFNKREKHPWRCVTFSKIAPITDFEQVNDSKILNHKITAKIGIYRGTYRGFSNVSTLISDFSVVV